MAKKEKDSHLCSPQMVKGIEVDPVSLVDVSDKNHKAPMDRNQLYVACTRAMHDNVVSDSRAAMKMTRPGGRIVWHDYGVWDGVTRALDELEERDQLGLKNIRGTSLVYWERSAR